MMNTSSSSAGEVARGKDTPGGWSVEVCVLKDELHWAVLYGSAAAGIVNSLGGTMIFNTDSVFVYDPFHKDFGPLNLAQTWKYCRAVDSMLAARRNNQTALVHVCSPTAERKANSAYLAAAYAVIRRGMTPQEAFQPFAAALVQFEPFRDATYGNCSYQLKIVDCLAGLYHAMQLKWFDFGKFDAAEYEEYEKVVNGDLNWIIPGKFIAFSGPLQVDNDAANSTAEISIAPTPQDYVKILRKLGVKTIIRLNTKQYSRRVFVKAGFFHIDLCFSDGSCPSNTILSRFLRIAESNASGVIAVHCKAGLGRTGTLIGCYAIKHYKFKAQAWIGWNRICRPGSILGPQQFFLHEYEQRYGEEDLSNSLSGGSDNRTCPEGVTIKLPVERPLARVLTKASYKSGVAELNTGHLMREELSCPPQALYYIEDKGQGERLMSAKNESLQSRLKQVDKSLVSSSAFAQFTKSAATNTVGISTSVAANKSRPWLASKALPHGIRLLTANSSSSEDDSAFPQPKKNRHRISESSRLPVEGRSEADSSSNKVQDRHIIR